MRPVRLVTGAFLATTIGMAPLAAQTQNQSPNLIIISCDDLGYGDLGCQGHPTIRTPSIDRLAATGQRWTNFYVAAPVCTPSRAALLTGRLPIRSGMYGTQHRVLTPESNHGIPQSEVTLAEALANFGYRTMCVGKWHLGHGTEHLPNRHGFDAFFGLPYSNDMDAVYASPRIYQTPHSSYWNVPLMRDASIIERPANQPTLTQRYTQAAEDFLTVNRDRPFFLYLAHTMPHVPLFASSNFAGRSERGRYGDVVEELDASVGCILAKLSDLGIEDRTLVVFTSDNGPWLPFGLDAGSAGPLRGGKGGTFEGGMRVPMICNWPKVIHPGIVTGLGSTLDLMPTFCAMIGLHLPGGDDHFDGVDLSPALLGTGPSARQTLFYYRGAKLFAVRHGQWKAHYLTRSDFGSEPAIAHDPPLLFHLGHDPGERFEVGAENPDVIVTLRAIADHHLRHRTVAPSLLDN